MKTKIIRCIICLLLFSIISVSLKLYIKGKMPVINTETTKVDTTVSTTVESSSSDIEESTTKEAFDCEDENETVETTTETTHNTVTSTNVVTTTKTETTTMGSFVETGFEGQMLSVINTLRQRNGSSSLEIDPLLNSLAQERAKEISISYTASHKRPNGSEWSTVLSKLDGTYLNDWYTAGENIAYGQKTVDEIMNDFTNSSEHFSNMISTNYNKVGLGCYNKNGVRYWVQIFVGI